MRVIQYDSFKDCNPTIVVNFSRISSYDIYNIFSSSVKIINADDQIGDFFFRYNDYYDEHVLVGYIGNDKILTLPQSYNGKNYAIGNSAFDMVVLALPISPFQIP